MKRNFFHLVSAYHTQQRSNTTTRKNELTCSTLTRKKANAGDPVNDCVSEATERSATRPFETPSHAIKCPLKRINAAIHSRLYNNFHLRKRKRVLVENAKQWASRRRYKHTRIKSARARNDTDCDRPATQWDACFHCVSVESIKSLMTAISPVKSITNASAAHVTRFPSCDFNHDPRERESEAEEESFNKPSLTHRHNLITSLQCAAEAKRVEFIFVKADAERKN